MDKRGSFVYGSLLFLAVALFAVFFFISKDERYKLLWLIVAGIVMIGGGSILIWQMLHPPHRLRKKIDDLEKDLGHLHTDELKDRYKDIYALYMKLSEKNKKNFYATITRIREHIEEQMVNEKRMEDHIQNADKGSIEERKNKYEQMHATYRKLPEKVQQKYYQHIVKARDALESGK